MSETAWPVKREIIILRSCTSRVSIGAPTQSQRVASPALALAVMPSTAVCVLRLR